MHIFQPRMSVRGRAWYGLGLAAALLLGGCSTPPAPAPARPQASYLTDEQAHDIAIHALGLVAWAAFAFWAHAMLIGISPMGR